MSDDLSVSIWILLKPPAEMKTFSCKWHLIMLSLLILQHLWKSSTSPAQTLPKAFKTSLVNTLKNNHPALNCSLATCVVSHSPVRWALLYQAVSQSWFLLDQHCLVGHFNPGLCLMNLICPSGLPPPQLHRPNLTTGVKSVTLLTSIYWI